MEKKKYRMWYKCSNCGHEASREFDKGVEASVDLECQNCGCSKFNPKPSKKPPLG